MMNSDHENGNFVVSWWYQKTPKKSQKDKKLIFRLNDLW